MTKGREWIWAGSGLGGRERGREGEKGDEGRERGGGCMFLWPFYSMESERKRGGCVLKT